MTIPQLNKVTIDVPLVRRLIDSQIPQWKTLQIRPVSNSGWDNRTFHLGNTLSVRLPSSPDYVPQVEKEQKWLPILEPLLPVTIPQPVTMGSPCKDYPWPWSVYRWIEGDTASFERLNDRTELAASLGVFLKALQHIDPTHGPPPGEHNFYRGGPLETYDEETRQAMSILGDQINAHQINAIWAEALGSSWQGAPVWVHGDINPDNLLLRNGRLSAVIDFGCLAVGDPACDLVMAWNFFERDSREAFCRKLDVDEQTWARGRGWALWKTLIVLAGLTGDTDSAKRAQSWRALDQIIEDYQQKDK